MCVVVLLVLLVVAQGWAWVGSVMVGGGSTEAVESITFVAVSGPTFTSASDLSTYTTSSWTPPSSGLLFACISQKPNAVAPNTPTMSGNGLTWVRMATRPFDTATNGRISLFVANATGSTPGTTSIDFAGQVQLSAAGIFWAASGVNLTHGTAGALVQEETWNGTTGTTASLTLSAASHAANRPISCFHHSVAEGKTPRTTWTEAGDVTIDASGTEAQYRQDAFEVTASASWATSAQWVAIAAEVRSLSDTSVPRSPGPVTAVLENCNRTEGPPLGTNWSTLSWAGAASGLRAANPVCNTSNTSSAYRTEADYGPDSEVYASLSGTVTGGSTGPRLALRMQDEGTANWDGYVCDVTGDTSIALRRYSNGSVAATYDTITQIVDDGDAMLCRMVGDRLSLSFNNDGAGWIEIGAARDSTITAAGRIGIYMVETGSEAFDNFGGGTLP